MREKKLYKIEVHVAGICFRDNQVLLAKRTAERKLYPNLWESGGGQVRDGENFEEALKRSQKDELGILINPVGVIGTYEIVNLNIEQKKIPGLKIICEIKGFVNGKEPQISDEHSQWCWQSIDKLDELEMIPGLKEEIEEGYTLIQKHRQKLEPGLA